MLSREPGTPGVALSSETKEHRPLCRQPPEATTPSVCRPSRRWRRCSHALLTSIAPRKVRHSTQSDHKGWLASWEAVGRARIGSKPRLESFERRLLREHGRYRSAAVAEITTSETTA